MQVAESGSVSPAMQEKLRDFKSQWAQTILDHVQRLRAAFGETGVAGMKTANRESVVGKAAPVERRRVG
jgi:hypothetical protein